MNDKTSGASSQSFESAMLAHMVWLDSDGKDGARLSRDGEDLSRHNLSKIDLRYASLRGASFIGSDLAGADFRSADLRGARFFGANLDGARLDRSDVTGTDLRVRDLRGCSMVGMQTDSVILNVYVTWKTLLANTPAEKNLSEANQRFKRTSWGLLATVALFVVIFTLNKSVLTGDLGLKALPGIDSLDTDAPFFYIVSSAIYTALFCLIVGVFFYRYVYLVIERREVADEAKYRSADLQALEARGRRYRTEADHLAERFRRSEIDSEEREVLRTKVRDAESKSEQYVKEKQEREALDALVTKTIQSLKGSLKSSDDQRSSLAASALLFRVMGIFSFGVSTFWLGYTGFIAHFGQHSESSLLWQAMSSEKWGSAVVLFTFPITILLIGGTALLRHEGKLLQEVRVYTEYRLQIDTMSGLLEASRYAETGDRREKLFLDTFLQIRDTLLKKEPASAAVAAPSKPTDTDKDDAVQELLNLFKGAAKKGSAD